MAEDQGRDDWLFKVTTKEEQHERRKKNFAAKASFGEPYNMAELRRALDDDREERAAKRAAAAEAKRKQEEETFRLTPLAPPLKAKAEAKAEEPVYKTEIEVGPICHCRSFLFPHFLEAHQQLAAQWDWRTPEERERDERESKQGIRRSEPGRRQPADRVRDAADRGPGKTGRQAG